MYSNLLLKLSSAYWKNTKFAKLTDSNLFYLHSYFTATSQFKSEWKIFLQSPCVVKSGLGLKGQILFEIQILQILPYSMMLWYCTFPQINHKKVSYPFCLTLLSFLDGLSVNLNHLIASCMTNYDWPFGTLLFGLIGSNLDTMDLEAYPRTYSGHFCNMSIFGHSRTI